VILRPAITITLQVGGDLYSADLELAYDPAVTDVLTACREMTLRLLRRTRADAGWPAGAVAAREKITWLCTRLGVHMVEKGQSLTIEQPGEEGEEGHWHKFMFDEEGEIKSIIKDGVNVSTKIGTSLEVI
tara:strand:+ start:110 stop:499 length:390 start_codon:yes stop_codon:yes gene_type:complete